jgi:hypothetical protein
MPGSAGASVYEAMSTTPMFVAPSWPASSAVTKLPLQPAPSISVGVHVVTEPVLDLDARAVDRLGCR